MTGLKADRTGRSIPKLASRRDAKIKGPPRGQPFACLTLPLLESDAFRTMSNAERKILLRLIIEHLHHGGNENGYLPCTYTNFETFGVRRCSIKRALKGLQERGLIRRVRKGHLVPGCEGGAPSLYRLTFYASHENGGWVEATNDWKNYRAAKV